MKNACPLRGMRNVWRGNLVGKPKIVTVEFSGKLQFKLYGTGRSPKQLAKMLEHLCRGVVGPYDCVSTKPLEVTVKQITGPCKYCGTSIGQKDDGCQNPECFSNDEGSLQ